MQRDDFSAETTEHDDWLDEARHGWLDEREMADDEVRPSAWDERDLDRADALAELKQQYPDATDRHPDDDSPREEA